MAITRTANVLWKREDKDGGKRKVKGGNCHETMVVCCIDLGYHKLGRAVEEQELDGDWVCGWILFDPLT